MESLRDLERIEKAISQHQAAVQAANSELPALHAELVQARAIHTAEKAKAEAVRLAGLRKQLADDLAALDHSWNPATERKVIEAFSQFRQAKLSGQSWEALDLYVSKIKNPGGGRSPKRTWSSLLDWIKPTESAA